MEQQSCNKLPEPSEFPFPFAPYDIQLEFMKNLYNVLESGKLGIFESPTGTGKSLSIICGAVKWLKDHNEHTRHLLNTELDKLEEKKKELAKEQVDWFSSQSSEIEITRKLHDLKIKQKAMCEYDDKIQAVIKEGKKFTKKSIKYQSKPDLAKDDEPEKDETGDDDDVLLEEEPEKPNEADDDDYDSDSQEKKYRPTQIIIASRTHSQLAQFIGEIRKSPFHDKLRVVSLASRHNYCVNNDVRKLGSLALISDKCLDMQKKQKGRVKTDQDGKTLKKQKTSSCQCPYYRQGAIEELRDVALSDVCDIEDLIGAGKELLACPYYASRKAAEDAEVILVPYNTLLHKSTREASGVSLKDNVVIVDEAHNLLEALAQMHGSDLSYPQLFYSLQYLKCYKQRYNTMFSAITLRLLNQLIFVVTRLLSLLDVDFKGEATEIFTLERFVLTADVGQYNFFNLAKFCKGSKIAQKVRSYSLKYSLNEELRQPTKKGGVKDFLASIKNKNKPPQEEVAKLNLPSVVVPNNPLLAVISFLECLTYPCDDGRILLCKSPQKQDCKMQFLLLNPSSSFGDIVKYARAVVVAGGTMKPNGEFRDRLFKNAGADVKRIVEFACDHIIPPENILPIAVVNGPRQEKLLFNFENRMSMGDPLIRILKETCKAVKGGIVVFFPSYKYENWVYEQVKGTDFGRLLFREPKSSGSVEEVLEKYAATIKKSTSGVLLFSVVGGKLSEGLNFSDDLGRCVIVVGLPYANITAADLKEKMAYLDKKEGHGAGQRFYENMCMKAVNQCIGRAVRHRNDYASVLLLDERYGRTTTKNALPEWIKRSFQVCNYGEAFQLIEKFFNGKGA